MAQVSLRTDFPALEEQLVLAAPSPGGIVPPAGFPAFGGTAPSLEGQLATAASSSLPQHAWGHPQFLWEGEGGTTPPVCSPAWERISHRPLGGPPQAGTHWGQPELAVPSPCTAPWGTAKEGCSLISALLGPIWSIRGTWDRPSLSPKSKQGCGISHWLNPARAVLNILSREQCTTP